MLLFVFIQEILTQLAVERGVLALGNNDQGRGIMPRLAFVFLKCPSF
jgi:hypothetical protein